MMAKQKATITIFTALITFCLIINANAEEEPKNKSFSTKWTTISDLDKDCQISSAVVITIPNTNHDLNPRNRLNAPRLLKKVTGDFSVQVKVTSNFKPGDQSTGVGQPFNGAGLLIWENEKNYLRLERNAYGNPESLMCYPPLIEYWNNGKYGGFNSKPTPADEFFKGFSTWLKLERRGTQMTASYSHDGEKWTVAKKFEVDFPKEISAGIAALNTSNAEFTVAFERFEITTIKKE